MTRSALIVAFVSAALTLAIGSVVTAIALLYSLLCRRARQRWKQGSTHDDDDD